METANDVLTWLRPILELGWPALVTLAIALLWRYHTTNQKEMFQAYKELQHEYVQTLREVAGLRAALPTAQQQRLKPSTLEQPIEA